MGLPEADISHENTEFRLFSLFVGTHSTTGFLPGYGSPEPARYMDIKKWLSPALRIHIGVVLERFLCCITNNSF